MDKDLQDSVPPPPPAEPPPPPPPETPSLDMKAFSVGDMQRWAEAAEAAATDTSAGEGIPDASGRDKETPS